MLDLVSDDYFAEGCAASFCDVQQPLNMPFGVQKKNRPALHLCTAGATAAFPLLGKLLVSEVLF